MSTQVFTKAKQIPFDASWWEDFVQTTGELKKTTVFKDCLTKEETGKMRGHLLEALAELDRLRTTQFGYRVFIEGELQGNKGMEEVFDVPPLQDEALDVWAKRAFGEKKFGIILNRIEKFSPELAQMIALKIKPLLDKVGIPALGVTFTIFIGNYGWTPIGIHTDGAGENVMHFHLGPGPKTMYTWDWEEYESKTTAVERLNNTNIEKHLPDATAFPFEEGDLYFMPEREYHVGKSDDLSIGLTLWFNNHVKTELTGRALRVITDQYLKDSIEIMEPDTASVEDCSIFDDSLALMDLPPELEKMTFKELLSHAYKDFRYSLYSNAGYWTRPFPMEGTEIEFGLEDYIQLISPYKIQYNASEDGTNLQIYVRGSKLILANHPCIANLLDTINSGKRLRVSALMETLDPSWDHSIGSYILNMIYTHHGIHYYKAE